MNLLLPKVNRKDPKGTKLATTLAAIIIFMMLIYSTLEGDRFYAFGFSFLFVGIMLSSLRDGEGFKLEKLEQNFRDFKEIVGFYRFTSLTVLII